MTKTFTEHDLIRYLYRETTEKEAREIDQALRCDSELMALYNDLQADFQQLKGALLDPPQRAIKNILNYSRGVKAKE